MDFQLLAREVPIRAVDRLQTQQSLAGVVDQAVNGAKPRDRLRDRGGVPHVERQDQQVAGGLGGWRPPVFARVVFR